MSKHEECLNGVYWEQELIEEVPCRENEIDSVLQLIGRPRNRIPQSIFINGDTSTGKTYVTSKILEKLQYRHVFIDCVQCYMPKLLFGCILNKAADYQVDCSNQTSPYANCDNLVDFINHLKDIFDSKVYKRSSYIIVLDKCERLRDMSANFLPAFLRLQELTKLNVCVIFLSSIAWEKFYMTTGFYEPLKIYFPQYSKDDVLKILSVNHPWHSDDALYQNYLSLFLSVFYRSCRDLNELKYMVNVNFAKHCEPVLSGKVGANKLWQSITPHLKSALGELYLRMVASSSLDGAPVHSRHQHDIMAPSKLALSFELPYYSKFFLIAAYLASYSPSKLDKALFVKLSDKRKKRKRVARSKNEVLSDMLLGPKPFTVDRLLAIFYSIVDGEVNFTGNLSAQVSSLVKLQLLMVVNDSIDCKKFKCAVGLEFIKTIAKTVEFDIIKYLFPPK